MKTLIVYYSRTGNNSVLARKVAEVLSADLFEIKTRPYPDMGKVALDMMLGAKPALHENPPDAGAYDFVLFMGPVWMFHIPAPLRSCMSIMRRSLKKYGYVSVSGGSMGPNPGLARELIARAGRNLVMALDLNVVHLCSVETDLATGKYRDYLLADHPEDLERLTRLVATAFGHINHP